MSQILALLKFFVKKFKTLILALLKFFVKKFDYSAPELMWVKSGFID